MRTFEAMPATILFTDLTHGRTGNSIRLRATIFEHYDGRCSIEYSHAPRPTAGAGAWFSDSLSSAETYDEARDMVDVMCHEIEKAFDVLPWR